MPAHAPESSQSEQQVKRAYVSSMHLHHAPTPHIYTAYNFYLMTNLSHR